MGPPRAARDDHSKRRPDLWQSCGGNSRRHIVAAAEKSLARLLNDWVDVYQNHRPDSAVPIDETLRALDDQVRQGKAPIE